SSRSLPDRILNRAIEQAWVRETRSPSNIMQELASRFRQNGLHIFRHRRGMLFVSPIRVRAFVHEHAGVSPLVNAILEAVSGTAVIENRAGRREGEGRGPGQRRARVRFGWEEQGGLGDRVHGRFTGRARKKTEAAGRGGGAARGGV